MQQDLVTMQRRLKDSQRVMPVLIEQRESVRQAFARPLVASILGGTINEKGPGNSMMKGPGGAEKATAPQQGAFAELLPSMTFLEKELEKEIAAGKMQVRLEARGLVVSLREAAFFPSGADTILPAAYGSLEKIAETIGKIPNPVRLEGHTDSVGTADYNQKLSDRRAQSVTTFAESLGVDPSRFTVKGYGFTQPVATNSTPEGRQQNRRVEVAIMANDDLKKAAEKNQMPQ